MISTEKPKTKIFFILILQNNYIKLQRLARMDYRKVATYIKKLIFINNMSESPKLISQQEALKNNNRFKKNRQYCPKTRTYNAVEYRRIFISLAEEDYKDLLKIARDNGIKATTYVRLLVLCHIDEYEEKSSPGKARETKLGSINSLAEIDDNLKIGSENGITSKTG
jgi:hypothetical protein